MKASFESKANYIRNLQHWKIIPRMHYICVFAMQMKFSAVITFSSSRKRGVITLPQRCRASPHLR